MERRRIRFTSPRARAGPATVAGGKFTASGAPAASYGGEAPRACPPTAVGRNVATESADQARQIQKPAPQADGRLCAVAESLLGWDEQQNPPESLLSFLAFHFGIPSGIPRVVLATIDTEDPKELAARLQDAVMQYVRTAAGQVRHG